MANQGSDSHICITRSSPSLASPSSYTSRIGHQGISQPVLSREDINQLVARCIENDTNTTKTWSRLFVENFLMKFKWYNPHRDEKDGPDLRKSWAFYEHITLARRVIGENSSASYARAEPGDGGVETELYPAFSTPESALNEWGIGVGLYFATVRTMAFVLLIAGLISTVNIVYYRGNKYNGGLPQNVFFTMKGSAICVDQEWVACPTCTKEQWPEKSTLFATGTNVQTGIVLALVKRNRCDGAQLQQGMTNYAAIMFLIFASMLMTIYQTKREIRFDEAKLTSTDYSVRVSNPPPDATDPEVWRSFFDKFCEKQVTVCTIALNNENLVRALFIRRILLSHLQNLVPRTDLDNETELEEAIKDHVRLRDATQRSFLGSLIRFVARPFVKPFNLLLTAEEIRERIKFWTNRVIELQKKVYQVTDVFITFETEAGQRSCLEALQCGKIDIWRQNTHAVSQDALFGGKILAVSQPTEPNAVRWLDLHSSTLAKMTQRLITFLITFGLIVFSGFLINKSRVKRGPKVAAPVVALLNFIIPNICKLLLLIEKHSTEEGRQTSLYLKITLFRWINTAVLTKIITPFTDSIGADNRDLIPSINAILITEMLFTPFLRILDLWGNIRKHVIAPRAITQEDMHLSFNGTFYNLSERYTDFTKVIFLCYFYCALNPNTFFIGSATLLIQYYTDKFCLMRMWQSAPFIGTQLAIFSRKYFLSFALVVCVIVASYDWAQHPYDNICDPADPETGFGGQYVLSNGKSIDPVSVSSPDAVVYCNQNVLHIKGFNFPAFPSIQQAGLSWMNYQQKIVTRIFGVTSIIVLVGFLVMTFGHTVMIACLSLFHGTYLPVRKDQNVDFSNVQEIYAYVPNVKIRFVAFPLLACDIDEIDHSLVGWKDQHRSYDFYNMIYDIPYPGMKRKRRTGINTEDSIATNENNEASSEQVCEVSEGEAFETARPMFSIVKHWPPPWAQGTASGPNI